MRVPHLRDWPTSAHVALTFLIAALMLDLTVVLRLRSLGTAVSITPPTMRTASRIVIATPNDAEIVREAANRSPFDAETSPPVVIPLNAVMQQSVPAAPARPRLVGTVVEGHGGGFVVVELPDGRMQLVRIGERAGELRLRSVSAGEAVFDDARGGRVSLRTPRPGLESRP